MRYLNQRSKPALDQERSEVLQQLGDWLCGGVNRDRHPNWSGWNLCV